MSSANRLRLTLGRLPKPLRARRARPIVTRFSRMLRALDRRQARRERSTIGGWVAGDVPVLLLTTTGRRTGRQHTTPLLYHRTADGSVLLIAANGAADWHPDWFLNLTADPQVTIQINGTLRDARAEILRGNDRDDSWPEATTAFPGLEGAQRATRREIPLVRLTLR